MPLVPLPGDPPAAAKDAGRGVLQAGPRESQLASGAEQSQTAPEGDLPALWPAHGLRAPLLTSNMDSGRWRGLVVWAGQRAPASLLPSHQCKRSRGQPLPSVLSSDMGITLAMGQSLWRTLANVPAPTPWGPPPPSRGLPQRQGAGTRGRASLGSSHVQGRYLLDKWLSPACEPHHQPPRSSPQLIIHSLLC